MFGSTKPQNTFEDVGIRRKFSCCNGIEHEKISECRNNGDHNAVETNSGKMKAFR